MIYFASLFVDLYWRVELETIVKGKLIIRKKGRIEERRKQGIRIPTEQILKQTERKK
jgi:hypothetical protein